MALDRQRILTELGSVVNQLQSADCGCMGKLFNNPGQNGHIPMGNPLPTCGGCRRGCCHGHGYGGWNSGGPCGDPYTMNHQPGMHCGDNYTMINGQGMQRGDPYKMNSQQGMQRPCMGACNPPKLYADTYKYLSENLLQPTIKEVYNDLSSITPENTIMNNPIANQMVGLTNALAAQNNSGGDSQYTGVPNPNMTNIGSKQASEPGNIRSNADKGGNRLTGPMVIDAPQSPHGAGVTQLSAQMLNNQGIYPNNNVVGYQNPNPNQYNNMRGANISLTNPNFHNMQGFQNISNTKTNPATQQMESSHHHHHGQHSQGIAKFNEMFPGVIKGMGGDLNYDPMAVAIQMNPANRDHTAMETKQKIISNNNAGINKMFDGTGHTNATPEGPGTETINNSNITHNRPNVHQVENINSDVNSTTVTQQPISQNQIVQKNLQRQQYNQLQPTLDPNSGNAMPLPRLPTLYEGALGNQNDLSQVTNPNVLLEVKDHQQVIKEPIFQADTSKYYVPTPKRYEYNTLGQPIEMLPAQVYHTREPALPQTLSPQHLQRIPSHAARVSNVKSTVSKTSLMGTKAIGKTASRSQLQHIYNQYKGSQSYTQNNVRAPDNGGSYSDGKLNIPCTNVPAVQQNIPVERVGGDALAKKPDQDQRTSKVEQVKGQIGDAPGVMKATGDVTNPQVTYKKTRNGLQDQVFTSYPTSAAWSFHGDGSPRYYSGYRNRYRV